MDFLDWGAKWLHDQMKESASFVVRFVWPEGSETATASFVDEQGRTLPGAVKTPVESTLIMLSTEELVSKGIPTERRGMEVLIGDKKYVVVPRPQFANYNDSYHYNTVLSIKYVPDDSCSTVKG